MSRTRKIVDTVERVEGARHGWRHVRETVGPEKLVAKDGALEIPPSLVPPSGADLLRAWRDAAIAELAELGLPATPRVRYDPAREGLPLLDEDTVAGMQRDRLRISHGVAGLDRYLILSGFGALDDEALLARIVITTATALDERLDFNRRLDAAIRARGAVGMLNSLYGKDAAVAELGSASKARAWAADLAGDMVRANPTASAAELFGKIDEYEARGDTPDGRGLIVYRDGGRLVCVEDATGRTDKIGTRAWARYVARAKKP